MNKKIATELAIGILLIVAFTVGGIFWMQNRTENETPQSYIGETDKYVDSSIKNEQNQSSKAENKSDTKKENGSNLNIWTSCENKEESYSLISAASDQLEKLRKELNPDPNRISLNQSDFVIKNNGHIYYQDTDLSSTKKQVYFKGDVTFASKNLIKLPENLFIEGNLIINKLNTNFSLPQSIIVRGNLVLNGDIISLPKKLVVNDYLTISNTKIDKLPEGILIGKNIDASYTPLRELPQNFFVGGNMGLARTKILKLPSNLSVFGDLNLTESPISSLPCALNVGNTLIISGTSVSTLPDDLRIGHILDTRNTPLSKILSENPEILSDVVNKTKAEVFK